MICTTIQDPHEVNLRNGFVLSILIRFNYPLLIMIDVSWYVPSPFKILALRITLKTSPQEPSIHCFMCVCVHLRERERERVWNKGSGEIKFRCVSLTFISQKELHCHSNAPCLRFSRPAFSLGWVYLRKSFH